VKTLIFDIEHINNIEEKSNISNAIFEHQYLRSPKELHSYNYYSNNPLNWIDPFGLSRSSCSGKDQCISNCLKKNYGVLYEWANSLSPIGLFSGGYEIYSYFTSTALKRRGFIALYTYYNTGKRLLKTYSQFGKFNAIMGVVGAVAFGFQMGALGYGYFACL